MAASVWSELEALGRTVGTQLEYGAEAKLALLTFAAGAYSRRMDVLDGWDIQQGTDPTTGTDGFWFTLPVSDPALLAAIYDPTVVDIALVRERGQADATIFHVIRKVPAVTEPREARIFTQYTEEVWNDQ